MWCDADTEKGATRASPTWGKERKWERSGPREKIPHDKQCRYRSEKKMSKLSFKRQTVNAAIKVRTSPLKGEKATKAPWAGKNFGHKKNIVLD